MDITIDTPDNKIIVRFQKNNSNAVIIPKIGNPMKTTIPELIEALEMVAKQKTQESRPRKEI